MGRSNDDCKCHTNHILRQSNKEHASHFTCRGMTLDRKAPTCSYPTTIALYLVPSCKTVRRVLHAPCKPFHMVDGVIQHHVYIDQDVVVDGPRKGGIRRLRKGGIQIG